MNIKKQPVRKCIGCGEMKTKKELIRILKTPEGEIAIDATGKKNGRGAYICNSAECLKKAIKCKAVERSLKENIPSGVYDHLKEELMNIGSESR